MVIGLMFLWLYIIGFAASIPAIAKLVGSYMWFMYERENKDGYRRYKPEGAQIVAYSVALSLIWPLSYLALWTVLNVTAVERAEIADAKRIAEREKAQAAIKADEEAEKARVQMELDGPPTATKKVIDAAMHFLPPAKRKSL